MVEIKWNVRKPVVNQFLITLSRTHQRLSLKSIKQKIPDQIATHDCAICQQTKLQAIPARYQQLLAVFLLLLHIFVSSFLGADNHPGTNDRQMFPREQVASVTAPHSPPRQITVSSAAQNFWRLFTILYHLTFHCISLELQNSVKKIMQSLLISHKKDLFKKCMVQCSGWCVLYKLCNI